MEIETGTQPVFNTRLKTEIPHRYHNFCMDWGELHFQRYEFGDIILQHFPSKPYSVHVLRLYLRKYSELYFTTEDASIALQLNFKQSFGYFDCNPGKYVVAERHYGLLHLDKGRHTAFFDPGQYEIVHIELRKELLEDLAQSRQDIKMLLHDWQEGCSYSRELIFLPINYMVSDAVNEMKWCRERGADLFMEFKTSILNLLNLYRKDLNNHDYIGNRRQPLYLQTLIKIIGEISADPNKLHHNIGYFSRKYAMSESTLQRAFKAYFKKPLASFVTEQCMKKAAWLSRESGMSIEDIAFEVGYSEKSGFLRAFKRHHGVTPKQLQS